MGEVTKTEVVNTGKPRPIFIALTTKLKGGGTTKTTFELEQVVAQELYYSLQTELEERYAI